MTPYFESEHVTVFCAACMDVLPSLATHDLLLTDPPYGIGESGGKSRRSPPRFRDAGWDTVRRPPLEILEACCLAQDVIIWGGNYYADILPASPGWLYWAKNLGGDFSDGELAWTSRTGALRSLTLSPVRGRKRCHPTQKPVALMEWCILQLPKMPTSILDPYAGAGTTGVAAQRLGIRATLIERERDYCDMIVARLSTGVYPE